MPSLRYCRKPNISTTLLLLCLILLCVAAITACSSIASTQYDHPTQRPYRINNKVYYPIPSSYGFNQIGMASWYGKDFHGRFTSNGETYNMYGMTAAHKTLPMNTILLVRNLENQKEIVVRVNDRGPFIQGRIIDLTYTGAKALNIIGKGTAKVQIVALGESGKKEEEIIQLARQFYQGEYYVQIGSFANPDNALRLQDRFLQAGHQTLIQKYNDLTGVYYRVHVYVGKSLQGAMQARSILEKRGYQNAFVIAR